jgi:hypothetical protein
VTGRGAAGLAFDALQRRGVISPRSFAHEALDAAGRKFAAADVGEDVSVDITSEQHKMRARRCDCGDGWPPKRRLPHAIVLS